MIKRQVLGIAGGMGPYATALFYKKLTELTQASSDQEHIECIIHSVPQTPDRSAFLTGKCTANPLEKLLDICRALEKQVDIIAFPCMTSHHFYEEIASSVAVPVLDMHSISAEEANARSLGIMATEGTLVSGRLQRILREHGIQPIMPSNQRLVTELIYGIKAGNPYEPGLFRSAARDLADRGASKILLACSELQVYADEEDLLPLLDATMLLARRCIEAVGGSVREL